MLVRWPLLSGRWRYIGFRSGFLRGIAASRGSNTRTPSNQWEDADLNLAAGHRPIKTRLETGRARYRLGWVLAGFADTIAVEGTPTARSQAVHLSERLKRQE
jgi:hypothetical protein